MIGPQSREIGEQIRAVLLGGHNVAVYLGRGNLAAAEGGHEMMAGKFNYLLRATFSCFPSHQGRRSCPTSKLFPAYAL